MAAPRCSLPVTLAPEVTFKGVPQKEADLYAKEFLRKSKGADDAEVLVSRHPGQVFRGEGLRGNKQVTGAYQPRTNTSHLFTATLKSIAEFRATLQHEILAHKGLGLSPEADRAQAIEVIRKVEVSSQVAPA